MCFDEDYKRSKQGLTLPSDNNRVFEKSAFGIPCDIHELRVRLPVGPENMFKSYVNYFQSSHWHVFAHSKVLLKIISILFLNVLISGYRRGTRIGMTRVGVATTQLR